MWLIKASFTVKATALTTVLHTKYINRSEPAQYPGKLYAFILEVHKLHILLPVRQLVIISVSEQLKYQIRYLYI
jgi:hypothetical protein